MRALVDPPRAVVVLRAGDRCLWASIDHRTSCDLDLVDRLLWLHLTVRRFGWTMHLEHIDDDLGNLLDLVGVAGWLTPPRDRPFWAAAASESPL